MANLLLDAASAILPSVADALLPSTPQNTNVPASNTDRTVVSTQALPAPPPLPLQPSIKSNHSGLIIPFQHYWNYVFGIKDQLKTVTISTHSVILNIAKHYRDAELVSLEAVIYPTAASYKFPITVDVVWTPDHINPDQSELLNTPGSARITSGGLNLMQQGVVACNLGYINPIVKCPIPYTNHPRLTIFENRNPDVSTSSTTILCIVIFRGSLRVSHPIAIASS